MNLRLVLFGLIIAGSILYALVPDTPVKRILVVTGCTEDDAKWRYLRMDEFPGTTAQFNGAELLVWNKSGRMLEMELVEYGSGNRPLSGGKRRHLLKEGVQLLPERPNFLMREAPDQISVPRGQFGVEVRWQLTCR